MFMKINYTEFHIFPLFVPAIVTNTSSGFESTSVRQIRNRMDFYNYNELEADDDDECDDDSGANKNSAVAYLGSHKG